MNMRSVNVMLLPCIGWNLSLLMGKRVQKVKQQTIQLPDLQKQLRKLTAEFPPDNKRSVKGRAKATSKDGVGNIYSAPNRMEPTTEGFNYETGASYDYLVDNLNGYYLT